MTNSSQKLGLSRSRYHLGSEEGLHKMRPKAWIGAIYKAGWGTCWFFPWLWEYWKLKQTTYYLSTHRLRIEEGVFNRQAREVMLFQLQDISVNLPFLVRFTSYGNVNIFSREKNDTQVELVTISNYAYIAEIIQRTATERQLEVPPIWVTGGYG